MMCGGGEIRTREAVKPQTFQVCGMNHYPTPPLELQTRSIIASQIESDRGQDVFFFFLFFSHSLTMLEAILSMSFSLLSFNFFAAVA